MTKYNNFLDDLPWKYFFEIIYLLHRKKISMMNFRWTCTEKYQHNEKFTLIKENKVILWISNKCDKNFN